jgi:hypothetical protein
MKDIDDNEAFMQLVLCNPQGALSPVELRLADMFSDNPATTIPRQTRGQK